MAVLNHTRVCVHVRMATYSSLHVKCVSIYPAHESYCHSPGNPFQLRGL